MDDPLLEVAQAEEHEAGRTDGCGGGGARGLLPAETLVPHCPAVALYGKMLSDSVLAAWWKRWGGRCGGSTA
eukprot:7140560-Lingulodinium_polyedra.AAC.1